MTDSRINFPTDGKAHTEDSQTPGDLSSSTLTRRMSCTYAVEQVFLGPPDYLEFSSSSSNQKLATQNSHSQPCLQVDRPTYELHKRTTVLFNAGHRDECRLNFKSSNQGTHGYSLGAIF